MRAQVIPLWKLIGIPMAHHSAYEVRPGMISKAIDLFTLFGWIEDTEAWSQGDWGQTRFMVGPGGARLQLTDPAQNIDERPTSEVHFAMSVADPKAAARLVADWARQVEEGSWVEEVNAGRWWVSLPSILTFSLEFAPAAELALAVPNRSLDRYAGVADYPPLLQLAGAFMGMQGTTVSVSGGRGEILLRHPVYGEIILRVSNVEYLTPGFRQGTTP